VLLAPLLALALAASTLQDPQARPPRPSTATDSLLRAFVDCPGWVPGCDIDFLRTEITYVNYMRNREDADVHVLATTQETGGGGIEYTLAFLGRRQFAGRGDTLRFTMPPTVTEHERRAEFAQRLTLGLARYLAATSAAPRLRLTFSGPRQAATARTHDPWNYWVFQLRFGGYLQGVKSYQSRSFNYNASVNRTTEAWKIGFSAYYNGGRDEFLYPIEYDTLGLPVRDTTVVSTYESWSGSGSLVRSLTDHWSARIASSVSRSTSDNQLLVLEGAPAIEYNIFPYSESTRRQLAFRLRAGVQHAIYDDTTIYDRTSETHAFASAGLYLSVTQPWGTAYLSLDRRMFLYDLTKNRLSLYASFEVRIFRGLSAEMWGNYAQIHDQLFLAKGTVSESEVLLRRRTLETSYSYWTGFSLVYRFGSIFNNVVNPRFGS